MENVKIDKDTLDKFIKDFQNFAKTENPFLQTNLPKFLKKTLSLIFNIYLTVPLFIGKNIIAKSILIHRDFIPKNIKKVKMPPELTVDFLDTKEIHTKYEETTQKEVDKFLEILEKNFKPEDLTFFLRNLQSLDFKKMKEINGDTIGYYTPSNNKITLLEGVDSNTIIHELFHMASTYRDNENDISYSGFHQRKKDFDFGRGLNEGYTELLANRYSNTDEATCYVYEKKYVTLLEEIIGKDSMQSLYLQANLKGLINELTKYQTEENIIQFIQNLDLWEKYQDAEHLKGRMDNCLKNIETFLIETYLEKTKIELNDITFNNESNLDDFLQKIKAKIYEMPGIFLRFSVDDIDSYLEKYLGNIIEEKKEQIQKYKFEQTELRIKQEQEKLNKIFGNFHFNHEPSKIGPIEDYNFGKLTDDVSPKR